MKVEAIIDLVSLSIVPLALIAGVIALWISRRHEVALPVLLDLLTASGLLHLAADPTLMRALSAATVLGIRHLINWSLSINQLSHGAPDDE